MPPIKYDEHQLVEMLKARSNTGFAYLYNNYGDMLFGAIMRVIGDYDIAEDILQDVFINIYRKIGSYDSTKSHLCTWMVAISRNLSIDVLKSKGYRNNQQTGGIFLAADIQSQGTMLVIDHIGLRGMCLKLGPKYYRVLQLSYFQGYSHEEIAAALGIPLGTVKTRIRSGLQK